MGRGCFFWGLPLSYVFSSSLLIATQSNGQSFFATRLWGTVISIYPCAYRWPIRYYLRHLWYPPSACHCIRIRIWRLSTIETVPTGRETEGTILFWDSIKHRSHTYPFWYLITFVGPGLHQVVYGSQHTSQLYHDTGHQKRVREKKTRTVWGG
jgi:hypothetical protein